MNDGLQDWERELLTGVAAARDAEGIGSVTFYRTDSRQVEMNNIVIDSISPIGANNGCICAEDSNGVVFHIPFVSHWEVQYAF